MNIPQNMISFGVAAVVSVLIACVPLFSSSYTVSLTMTLLLFFVLAQSWDWVGGELGYVNLSHFAFYGLGAYVFSIAYSNDLHPALSLFLAPIVTALIVSVISVPLFRLRGEYFAFATLALLPLFQILASNLKWLTKGSEGIILPAEQITETAFILMVALAFVTFVASTILVRSPFGLLIRSIRDDEEVAESIGVRILPRKIILMALSAAIAAIAGGIHGWYLSFIDPTTMFGLDVALVPIAMALLGGSALLWGPLVGVIVLVFMNQWLLTNISILHSAFYGLVILLVGRFLPGGLLRSQLLGKVKPLGFLTKEHHEHIVSAGTTIGGLSLSKREPDQDRVALECKNVTKRFGGNTALKDVSIRINEGEIVGLIGANGSGKTTLFNCISRILDLSEGAIVVYGDDIAHLRRDQIAHAGIGRSYQIPRSFERMTVRENITTALMASISPPDYANAKHEAARFAQYVGLADQVDVVVASLSPQKRKLLELARALATSPKILLVDEVASGLTSNEISEFVNHIRELRDVYGLTIIWVEHIFSALSQVVDRVVVLEQGSVIADGPLAEVLENENVQRSYFGAATGGEIEC